MTSNHILALTITTMMIVALVSAVTKDKNEIPTTKIIDNCVYTHVNGIFYPVTDPRTHLMICFPNVSNLSN